MPLVAGPSGPQACARSSGSPGAFGHRRCRRPPRRIPRRRRRPHPRPTPGPAAPVSGTGRETRLPSDCPCLSRAHVPHGGTTMRTSPGLWRTLFHAGCYEGTACTETPEIYVGMLVPPDGRAAATGAQSRAARGRKRNEPRRGWAAGLTEQGRRGCIGVYGAGDKVDFRSGWLKNR